MRLRRRLLLRRAVGVTVGGALTACDPARRPASREPERDPVAPLLASALRLVERYDAVLASHPTLAGRLRPLRTAHLAHATELAALIGAAPPGIPAGSPPAGGSRRPDPAEPDAVSALATLRGVEQRAGQEAVVACLGAPPARAALLGSIAAARATHLQVLQ